MKSRALISIGVTVVACIVVAAVYFSEPQDSAHGGLSVRPLVSEPTKDHSPYPTPTVDMLAEVTLEPEAGVFFQRTAGEIAEAVRESMEFASAGPVTLEHYQEVWPQDVGDNWWLSPDDIAEGDVPDIAVVCSGQFVPWSGRAAPGTTYPYALVMADRTYGDYAIKTGDDLQELLDLLP